MSVWALVPRGSVVQIEPDDPRDRFPEGFPWREAPDGTRLGDLYDGAAFARPAPVAPPPSRVVSAPAFLALFTPAEAAALWAADPALMFGAMTVLAQGAANLDSADLANLLGLAVAKGVLTRARAERVAAGLPPETPAETPADPA